MADKKLKISSRTKIESSRFFGSYCKFEIKIKKASPKIFE